MTFRDLLVGLAMPITRSYKTRWMVRPDMEQVLKIENGSYEEPLAEEDFLNVLRRKNSCALVAEEANRLIGFLVYELVETQYHVLNLAVDQQWRRRGVGTCLIERLKGWIYSESRQNRITVDVSEYNLGGQLFLRAVGFLAVKVIRCADADAYRMEFRGELGSP